MSFHKDLPHLVVSHHLKRMSPGACRLLTSDRAQLNLVTMTRCGHYSRVQEINIIIILVSEDVPVVVL